MRSARPFGRDGGAGPGDRIGLELDADQLERREAAGHRDEPATAAAVDVDDAAAARQVRRRAAGSAASTSWKKTAMSWRVRRLDGRAVAIRARSSIGVPVRKKSAIPPQSIDATTAWTNWPPRNSARSLVEQDRGHVLVDRQPAVLEGRQVVGVATPTPTPRRPRGASPWPPPGRPA